MFEKKNVIIVAVILLFVWLFIVTSKKDSSKSIVYDNTTNETEDVQITEFERYCVNHIKVSQKYEIIKRDMIVTQNINEKPDVTETITLKKGTEVLVKSIAKGKYVYLETENGEKYYKVANNFYFQTVKANSYISKCVWSFMYDALGHNNPVYYFLLICFNILIIAFGIYFLNVLDATKFVKQVEDKYPKENGIFKIIPGALLAFVIDIFRVVDENKMIYYFLNGNLLFMGGISVEKCVIWIGIFVIIYLFILNLKETYMYFTFGSILARSLIILLLNVLAFYVIYTIFFVGIALYALLLIVQCFHYDYFLPKKEGEKETI